MKSFSTLLNGALAGILVFVVLVIGLPATQAKAIVPQQNSDTDCNTGRSVSVSGTAVINVTPDRALIQLGVQSNGLTPSAVEAANTAATRQVINRLKELGVETKDIATDWYVIEPIYDDYNSLTIEGYRIHNIVAVTLRDVSQASRVIAASLEAGANQVIHVELYTSELRRYRDQAREMAMKAANEKAQALAGAAGASAGCVLNISENSWSSYNGWWYGGNNSNLWTQNVMQNAAPTGGEGMTNEDGPVSLGQISVRAEVNATYSLK
jgi:uncharacterized protein YggE